MSFTNAQHKKAWDKWMTAGKKLRDMIRSEGGDMTVKITVRYGPARKRKKVAS